MKKSIFSPLASLLLMAVLGLSACQKSDDNNNGGSNNDTGTHAVTPCPETGCTYNQYGNSNVQFLPYQGSYSNGFCGCNGGYRPIMHPGMGLGCAPSNFFNPYGYGGSGNQYGYGSVGGFQAWGYSYNSYNSGVNFGGGITSVPGQNSQWSSIPQVTYSAAVSGNRGNCYAQAAATCDLRTANSCGEGSVCRPTGGGTYLGICSFGRGVEGYTQANGCIQRMRNGGYMNICGYGDGRSYGNDGYNNQLPVR